MSIHSFVEAAEYLYENDFYNEALCLVCIAIDTSAKTKYPKLKVGERYKKFISTNFRRICLTGFPGIEADSIKIKVKTDLKYLNLTPDENGYLGMEDILYHVFRCGLVHDCAIDKSVKFIDATIIGDWEEGLFYLPKSIIKGLTDAVKEMNDTTISL